jgi:hypothetical protein
MLKSDPMMMKINILRSVYVMAVLFMTFAAANAQYWQVHLGAGINEFYPRSDGQNYANPYDPGLSTTAGLRYSIFFSDQVFASTGLNFRTYTVGTNVPVQPKYGVYCVILPVEIGYALSDHINWTGGAFLQYAFRHDLYGNGDRLNISKRPGYPSTNVGLTTAIQYMFSSRWTSELAMDYVLGSSYDQRMFGSQETIRYGRWALGLSVLYRLGKPE